jgi:hypothetical protein
MESPQLVAPGVKSFMDFTLRNCRQMKDSYMTFAVNIGLTVTFIVVIGGFLYYKYKGKPTREEVEQRKRQGQEYVMKKLGTHVATRQLSSNQSKNDSSVITGLPMWEKSLLIPG